MPHAIANNEIDGASTATVLRTLRNHTVLSQDEFRNISKKALSEFDDFDEIFSLLISAGLVETTVDFAKLTEQGQQWLDEFGAEFEIETEVIQEDDQPRKPYAVSKLKMESKQISVFQALRKIERGEIHLNPEFQRAFVWDIVKQSRLIESVLIRIPLPAFYLDATDRVKWSVVDGLQRLTTLYRYCRGDSFKLTGLQFLTELEGSTFSNLPAEYRVLIEDDTQLLFYNLMPGTPVEAKFTIFSRVNTGGMQLTGQEIRHALNQGKITEFLGRIAKNNTFLGATGGVVESLRMADRELILRALAFMNFGVESYKGFNELDAFLLNAMAELNKVDDAVLEKLEHNFLDSLEKVRRIFGRYAFRKFTEINGRRSPFNKALFEVWVIAVTPYSLETLMKQRTKILSKFTDLINYSPTFVKSISSSTGNFSAVSIRFSTVSALLEEICRDQ